LDFGACRLPYRTGPDTFPQYFTGHPWKGIAKQRKVKVKGSKGGGTCPTFVSYIARTIMLNVALC